MTKGEEQLTGFLDELGFDVIDEDTAVGELGDIPMSATVLSVDPPGIMFQFRVHREGTQT